MVNPQTVNVGIIVPLTGADVDTWGSADVNPNMVAIDGMLAGVQTIGLTNVPVTLTAPAGFVPTPGGGPTQAQNAVLRFTGALTAHVLVTLPLPGRYFVENLTTGNFLVQLQGTTVTEVVALPPGEQVALYNDGARVRFVGMGRMGHIEMWAGLNGLPLWAGSCTIFPYLVCDGSIYNVANFPYLGARLGATFGGNGITTFGVPDLRGRVPLAYDGTGARITAAGCGINGQTLGASLDRQTVTLLTGNLPPYTPTGSVATSVAQWTGAFALYAINGGGGIQIPATNNGSAGTWPFPNQVATSTFTGDAQGGASTPVNNVQPSLVTGVYVIKT